MCHYSEGFTFSKLYGNVRESITSCVTFRKICSAAICLITCVAQICLSCQKKRCYQHDQWEGHLHVQTKMVTIHRMYRIDVIYMWRCPDHCHQLGHLCSHYCTGQYFVVQLFCHPLWCESYLQTFPANTWTTCNYINNYCMMKSYMRW